MDRAAKESSVAELKERIERAPVLYLTDFTGLNVKAMTEYAKDHDVTIAVMGCRVNGPGETDDADLGLWCGPKHVNLKRGEESIGSYTYDEILPRLKEELDRILVERAGEPAS